MQRLSKKTLLMVSIVVIGLMCFAGLLVGTGSIGFGQVWKALWDGSDATVTFIVRESRWPRTMVAGLAGAGLAMAGLMMQTFFKNELAGPSVLGVSSGASMGVALVMLAGAGSSWVAGQWAVVSGAVAGAMAVLWLVLAVSRIFQEQGSLLIFGLMLSFVLGALVSVMQAGAEAWRIKSFVQWGMGSFDVRTGHETWWVGGALVVAALIALSTLKWYNAFLLGNENARSLGAPLDRVRGSMLLSAGLLTGVITAFCGPVAFIGLAVPHLARGFFRTSDHEVIFPSVLLIGAAIGMFCDLIVRAEFFGMQLPLNAVTSLVGAPIIIWVIVRNAKMKSLL